MRWRILFDGWLLLWPHRAHASSLWSRKILQGDGLCSHLDDAQCNIEADAAHLPVLDVRPCALTQSCATGHLRLMETKPLTPLPEFFSYAHVIDIAIPIG